MSNVSTKIVISVAVVVVASAVVVSADVSVAIVVAIVVAAVVVFVIAVVVVAAAVAGVVLVGLLVLELSCIGCIQSSLNRCGQLVGLKTDGKSIRWREAGFKLTRNDQEQLRSLA